MLYDEWKYRYIDLGAHYQKGSLQNKCRIGMNVGSGVLSVPLRKGKHSGLSIKNVQIANDSPWQSNHVRAIESTYGKTPYFIHYIDDLRELFSHNYDSLFDLTESTMRFLIDKMRLDKYYLYLHDYIEDETEYVIARHQLKYKNDFTNLETRIQRNMNILTGTTHLPSDISVRHSGLELLFHLGPEALLYIRRCHLLD